MTCNVLWTYCGAHRKIKGVGQVASSFHATEPIWHKTKKVDIMKPKCVRDYNITINRTHFYEQKLKPYLLKRHTNEAELEIL
jgi:hypothetical protein